LSVRTRRNIFINVFSSPWNTVFISSRTAARFTFTHIAERLNYCPETDVKLHAPRTKSLVHINFRVLFGSRGAIVSRYCVSQRRFFGFYVSAVSADIHFTSGTSAFRRAHGTWSIRLAGRNYSAG